jgi:hypothetical protein
LIDPQKEEGENMVYCPRCGTENPPGSLFCMKCGTRFPIGTQEKPVRKTSGFFAAVKQLVSSPLAKKAFIVSIAFLFTVSIIVVLFTGEKDPCTGIVCGNECYGTHLWKMKCFEGECIRDYIIEKDSVECGYTPPLETAEPETPEPAVDSDNDGVPDSADVCDNPGCTIVDSQGCPRDSDNDGVPDCYDDCPHKKGEKTNKGCPAEEEISIEIGTVNYNAPGNDNDNPNGEWVEIRNTGTQDVNMTGWKLYDEAYKRGTARDHVFVFPSGFILKAGRSVTIYTGQGRNTESNLYFGRAAGKYAAIWNNDGDCAFLEDAQGKLVDEYCW